MPFAVEEKWAGVISSCRSLRAWSLVPGYGPHPAMALRSLADARLASGHPSWDPAPSQEAWGSVENLQDNGENQTRIWNIQIGFF